MKRIILLIAALLLLAGCGNRQSGRDRGGADQAPAIRDFPMISVPSYVTTQEQAAAYFSENYWNRYDFADTAYLDPPELLEQAFVNYLGYLRMNPDRGATAAAMGSLFDRAAPYPATFGRLWDLADRYLYDPNSPMRNDELYIPVLHAVIDNPGIDSLLKLAPQRRLAMAMKNRVGERANDFSFTTEQGRAGRLYGISADWLVVLFYNLGCPACKSLEEHMQAVFEEPLLAEMLRSGKMKVLALYPDEDMTEWEKYLGTIPPGWINAYDGRQDINGGQLYDLKAIPSLYLLDRDKRVVLKDMVSPEEIYYAVMSELI